MANRSPNPAVRLEINGWLKFVSGNNATHLANFEYIYGIISQVPKNDRARAWYNNFIAPVFEPSAYLLTLQLALINLAEPNPAATARALLVEDREREIHQRAIISDRKDWNVECDKFTSEKNIFFNYLINQVILPVEPLHQRLQADPAYFALIRNGVRPDPFALWALLAIKSYSKPLFEICADKQIEFFSLDTMSSGYSEILQTIQDLCKDANELHDPIADHMIVRKLMELIRGNSALRDIRSELQIAQSNLGALYVPPVAAVLLRKLLYYQDIIGFSSDSSSTRGPPVTATAAHYASTPSRERPQDWDTYSESPFEATRRYSDDARAYFPQGHTTSQRHMAPEGRPQRHTNSQGHMPPRDHPQRHTRDTYPQRHTRDTYPQRHTRDTYSQGHTRPQRHNFPQSSSQQHGQPREHFNSEQDQHYHGPRFNTNHADECLGPQQSELYGEPNGYCVEPILYNPPDFVQSHYSSTSPSLEYDEFNSSCAFSTHDSSICDQLHFEDIIPDTPSVSTILVQEQNNIPTIPAEPTLICTILHPIPSPFVVQTPTPISSPTTTVIDITPSLPPTITVTIPPPIVPSLLQPPQAKAPPPLKAQTAGIPQSTPQRLTRSVTDSIAIILILWLHRLLFQHGHAQTISTFTYYDHG
jgi:hypothetical protein